MRRIMRQGIAGGVADGTVPYRAMDPLAEIVGESSAIEAIRLQIRKLVARQPGGARLPPVLISGETGTGKGLIARVLHRASPRGRGPFVDVNCAAIPDTLLEAELFGYERGAFTDARQAKAGLFQTAHGGTLFLDEIGLLAEALQAKLLKAIEERVVRRLGATRSEPFDAWLLCATNEDLTAAIREHRFREDLYHRLSVLTVWLPPLRERGEDIGLLAQAFLDRACADYGLAPKTLARDAGARLRAYHWPGNIRELANAMDRVALLSEQLSVTGDTLALPEGRPSAPVATATPGPTPEERVGERLLATLEQHRWNISRTAAALNLSRNTVRARIARFGLRPGETPGPRPPAPPSAPPDPEPVAPATEVASRPTPAPLAGPLTIRWERRQIAFLRATLIAPPGAGTLLDMNRVLETLVEKVRIFGGRLEEVSSGSVGAAFGLESVEEAPRHAAHAALAIQRALDRPLPDAPAFAARLGLHVAQSLVSRAGSQSAIDGDGKRAAWAALDAVLADADPGIAVSAAAAPLLERRFSLTPLPAGTGFGLSGPERTGLRAGGRMASFVGRRHELDLLESRLAAAVAGTRQVVGIAGEAGIGKSRLLYEFRQRLRGRALTWIEAHCVSYGSNIPYLPLIELLRRGCRLDERDTPAATADKVRRALAAVAIDPAEAVYLLQVLGVKRASAELDGLTAETVRARAFNVVRQMAVAASLRQPIVVVVEDLHWVDAASTALAPLIEGLDRIPVLILFTYRSGYTLPWLDRSFTTQIALQPLTHAESGVVVGSLMAATPLPDAVAILIVKQAEGNPFFLEELARAAQSGASPPPTVQQVLLSRINRLSDDARRVLETAAVLGREASARLLAAMVGEAGAIEPLRELIHAEFLYPGSGSAGETTYAFKHALTHEVVYQNLIGSERRRLHAAAGSALEALYAGRTDEVIEVLAHHFGESDLDDAAVDHAIRAGEKAMRRWANTEALAAFGAALARLGRMPDTGPNRLRRIDAVLKQSEVRFALGEHSQHLSALQGIADLIEDSGDPARRALWYYWMGFLHDLTGSNPEKTIAYCQEAAAVAEAAGLDDIRALVDSCLAQAYDFRGDLGQALAAGERALAFFEGRGNIWWACRTLWHLVVASMAVGEWDRALGYCRRALAHAEAMDDRRLRVRTLSLTGSVHIQRGDPETGLGWCDRALALSPMPFDASVISAIRGYGLARRGDLAAGIATLQDAVAWFRGARLRYSATMTALRLVEAYLAAGRLAEARSLIAEVLPDAEAAGYRHAEGIGYRLLGEATLGSDPGAAAEHLGTALRLLEEAGAQNERARTLVALARIRRAAGDHRAARELLVRALAVFEALRTVDEPTHVRALLAGDGSRPAE
jgi:DNA-binding NtrC family response regulator/tetratricopeptide (TPR) repeat protein